jgi:peroxiredoxin
MRARNGSLTVGDQAPDFVLSRLSGGGQVQLSTELREHPVVLVFGSYT